MTPKLDLPVPAGLKPRGARSLSTPLPAALLVLIYCGLLTAPCMADQILVTFTGTVTSVNDPNSHLTTPVHVGDSMTGTVSYNTNVVGFFEYGTLMVYNSSPGSFPFNESMTVDGITFQSSANYYEQDVSDAHYYQFQELRPAVPSALTGLSSYQSAILAMDLEVWPGTKPLDQPTSLAPLSSYFAATFQIQYANAANGDYTDISGTVTSLSAVDLGSGAPEPSGLAFLGMAAIFAALCLWKRKRAASAAQVGA